MISAICAVASAVDRPTFARLWPSSADTTYSIEPRPEAIARFAPRDCHQGGELDAPEPVEFGGQFGGVGERRHLRLRDEGGRLDFPNAGGDDRLE